jgi:uncharacterized protein (TIGR03435 family)
MNRWLLRALILLAATAGIRAQAPRAGAAEALPRFEAASVKTADPLASTSRFSTPPGSFHVENVPLLSVITMAFDVPDSRVTGAPDWVRSERFTITARMPAGSATSNRDLMIRALLVDRFALRHRVEPREGDGYELTLRGQDRRLGPQLKAVKSDCAERRLAGAPLTAECRLQAGPGSVDVYGYPIEVLTSALTTFAGAPVVDRTGLTGNFEIKLQWDRRSAGPLSAARPDDAGATGPSLFTAVEEQLGLRLRRARLPLDYLVIEQIERPTPD